MHRIHPAYTFNTTKQVGKTADYTVLYTDEEINVTPAANTVLTLPKISDLAGNMLGAKAYKFTKEGTGRYSVKIAANAADKILVNGVEETYIFLTSDGEEVVIQSDPVMKQWRIVRSSIGMFLATSVQDGKAGNISIESNALTGQINGMEINFSGPNGAATGANSYTALRIMSYVVGTNIMTHRGLFVGSYSHAVVAAFSGQQLAAEFEVGNALVTDAITTSVLSLNTRSAQLSATYHNASAYIMIRDYHASLLGVGALPNVFSFLDANMAWTIPTAATANKTAIFAAHHGGAESVTHYLKFSVAGTSYWIHCDNVGPAAA